MTYIPAHVWRALAISRRDVNNADHFHSRAGSYVFTLFSLVFLIITAVLFGKRLEQLKVSRIKELTPIRLSVVGIYVVAMFLVVGLSTQLQAAGLNSASSCSAGIVVCLVGYLGLKILLYLFLVERLHALNYRTPRLKDKFWVTFVAIVLCGFGTIAGTSFAYPFSQYSTETGKCTIGLTVITLCVLLGYDIFVNTVMTVLFINLLLTPLRFRYQNNVAAPTSTFAQRLSNLGRQKEPEVTANSSDDIAHPRGVVNAHSTEAIENLLRKSLTGLILVMFPTVVNLAILLRFQGHEPGWLCFTICQADVTFQVAVVHWMTRTPIDLAQKINLKPPGHRSGVPERMRSVNSATGLPPDYYHLDTLTPVETARA